MSAFDRLTKPKENANNSSGSAWGRLAEKRGEFRDRVEGFESRAGLSPSFTDMMREAVTGRQRTTQAVEELPSLMDVGVDAFLGDQAGALEKLGITVGLLLTGNQDRQVNMLSQIPEIEFQQDERGNVIASNRATEQKVMLNPPGLDKTDLARAATTATAFTPLWAHSCAGQTNNPAICRAHCWHCRSRCCYGSWA